MAVAIASGLVLRGELLDVRKFESEYRTGDKKGQKYTKYSVKLIVGHVVHAVTFWKEEHLKAVIGDAALRSVVEIPVIVDSYVDKSGNARVAFNGFAPRG